MTLRPFEHLTATSLKQASALFAKHRKKAVIVGGGTDLLGVLKDSVRPANPIYWSTSNPSRNYDS